MKQSKFSRRQFLSLTAGASAAAALAACTMPPAQPPAAGTTPEVAAQAPAKEATVIRVHARLGTQGDHFDHFAQKFNEAHPDILIKPELFADADYFQKLDTMIAGGTVGDAFWIYLGGGFTQYAATGIYAALDDIVKSENYDLGQFYPESVEALRYNGHLYSLPWILNVGSASAVYYNKPLLDAAGVAYPTADWTWDDMTNMAVKLTDQEKGVFGLATTNYYAGSPLAAARAYGGDLISADGTKSMLDDQKTLQGLQVFNDLYHKYKVSPMAGQGSGNVYQDFAAGKVGLYQVGFWGKTVNDYVAPDSWGVVATPKGPAGRGNCMFVDMVGVTARSQHPREAFLYLTELCSYEAGMDIWQVRQSVPGCRPDVWNSEAALADPHFKVYSDMMKADGMPPLLACPANFREKEYWQVVNEGLEPIWIGEKTVDQVIEDVRRAAQEVLDKPSLV